MDVLLLAVPQALEVGLGLKMSTGEEMQDTASAPPKVRGAHGRSCRPAS